MLAESLRTKLDKLLCQFSDEIYVINDPLGEVKKFKSAKDREIAAFIASGFAFGNIKSILAHLKKIWKITGDTLAEFVKSYFHSESSNPFAGLKYRWITGAAASSLFHLLGEMLRTHGSVEKFFTSSEDLSLKGKIQSFSKNALSLTPAGLNETDKKGLKYFFSTPDTGSACKRINLFLRWVVRKDPPDLGLWKTIIPSELIIPLDVHVARTAQTLGLTRRKTKDWKMAEEITEALRLIEPEDPLKYDFALHKSGVTTGRTKQD